MTAVECAMPHDRLPPLADTRRDLITAWAALDRGADNMAGDRYATAESLRGVAARAEVAFGNHAANLNLRTTHLRDICSAWRRAGFTREQTLRIIEAGLQVDDALGLAARSAPAEKPPLEQRLRATRKPK